MTKPVKDTTQNTAQKSMILTVAELSQSKANKIDIRFDPETEATAAAELKIPGLGNVSLQGSVSAMGADNWEMTADLGFSAVQNCVVTLNPVKTRVDAPLRRVFTADYIEPEPDSVVEMEQDEDLEPLTPEIDLYAIILEGIALNLPPYPRADDASLENSVFAGPGVTPMTDDDAKPFASLAALKDKLTKED